MSSTKMKKVKKLLISFLKLIFERGDESRFAGSYSR
mgnify:CR=1 FL=1